MIRIVLPLPKQQWWVDESPELIVGFICLLMSSDRDMQLSDEVGRQVAVSPRDISDKLESVQLSRDGIKGCLGDSTLAGSNVRRDTFSH